LPMLQDSQLVVASTEKGNVLFNKATLASIVLSTCPTDWRNQYKMIHKTVPELTRSMLFDLENIEKVFATKDGKKARTIKAPGLVQPPREQESCPRNMEREAVLEDQSPRRHAPPSTASGARRRVGPIRHTIPVSVAGLTRVARR
jgi:hypothetical protein